MEKKSKTYVEKEKGDQSEKYETISKELKEKIDKIGKSFDFKTFKKPNMAELEEVIIDKK